MGEEGLGEIAWIEEVLNACASLYDTAKCYVTRVELGAASAG